MHPEELVKVARNHGECAGYAKALREVAAKLEAQAGEWLRPGALVPRKAPWWCFRMRWHYRAEAEALVRGARAMLEAARAIKAQADATDVVTAQHAALVDAAVKRFANEWRGSGALRRLFFGTVG